LVLIGFFVCLFLMVQGLELARQWLYHLSHAFSPENGNLKKKKSSQDNTKDKQVWNPLT
jgi:hypothetical protein